jgi:hypothetical protein
MGGADLNLGLVYNLINLAINDKCDNNLELTYPRWPCNPGFSTFIYK